MNKVLFYNYKDSSFIIIIIIIIIIIRFLFSLR